MGSTLNASEGRAEASRALPLYTKRPAIPSAAMLNYIWFGLMADRACRGSVRARADAVTKGAVESARARCRLRLGSSAS